LILKGILIANIGLDPEGKPFRIKADVIYHTSLQDQGRCYLSYCPSGSRPMLAIILTFRIKADVSFHASLQDQGPC
jgi:hypothetical protein